MANKLQTIGLAMAMLFPNGTFAVNAIKQQTKQDVAKTISYEGHAKNKSDTFYVADGQEKEKTHEEIITMSFDEILSTYKEKGLEMIREHFIIEINKLRAEKNQERSKDSWAKTLETLKENEQLNTSAQKHAEDMVKNNYFSHINQKGEDWKVRIKREGYRSGEQNVKTGEIISQGPVTIKNTITSFMDSAPHRGNILHADYFEVGVGEKDGYIVICFGGSYSSNY